jgi:hypothetical protein
MKRLLLAILAGAALAYGAYRYFGIVPDLRAKEVREGQKVLDTTRDKLNAAAAEAQKRADQAAGAMPGEK